MPPRSDLASLLGAAHERLGAPAPALAACGKLGEAGALAVVAGQQPAAGLGPLYALAKAAAAVALARRWGAVPVFWIAADDHDLEEAATLRFPAAGGGLERLRAPADAPAGTPLDRLEAGDATRAWLEDWRLRLPASPAREEVFSMLARRCRGSWADWTAGVLLDLFGDQGLVVLVPSWLRAPSRGLLEAYAGKARALAPAVAERSRRLAASGFSLQVDPLPEVHLFGERGGIRRRLAPGGLDAPGDVLLSPDVLLRPVLQDALLPTLAQVTGPGETAYLAQAGPLYEGLGVSRPPLAPRPGITLLSGRDAGRLADWGLGAEAALLGAEALLEAIRRGPGPLSGEVRALSGRWLAELEGVAERARALDPGLARPAERTAAALREALAALARKAGDAEDRRQGIDRARVEALAAWTRPGGKPQERVLDSCSLLARFGPALAGALARDVDWTFQGRLVAVVEDDGAV